MITLYRNSDGAASDEIQERLRELTLAHRVVQLEDAAARPGDLPADAEPPILQDDGQTYTGNQAIHQHLEELGQLQDRWHRFGSDACYCDDDGEVL